MIQVHVFKFFKLNLSLQRILPSHSSLEMLSQKRHLLQWNLNMMVKNRINKFKVPNEGQSYEIRLGNISYISIDRAGFAFHVFQTPSNSCRLVAVFVWHTLMPVNFHLLRFEHFSATL